MKKRSMLTEIEELELIVFDLEIALRNLERENNRLVIRLEELQKEQLQLAIPVIDPDITI